MVKFGTYNSLITPLGDNISSLSKELGLVKSRRVLTQHFKIARNAAESAQMATSSWDYVWNGLNATIRKYESS